MGRSAKYLTREERLKARRQQRSERYQDLRRVLHFQLSTHTEGLSTTQRQGGSFRGKQALLREETTASQRRRHSARRCTSVRLGVDGVQG